MTGRRVITYDRVIIPCANESIRTSHRIVVSGGREGLPVVCKVFVWLIGGMLWTEESAPPPAVTVEALARALVTSEVVIVDGEVRTHVGTIAVALP